MPRERVDDLSPNPLLERIEIYRGFRTASARDARNNSERGCGFTGHLKRPLDIVAQTQQTGPPPRFTGTRASGTIPTHSRASPTARNTPRRHLARLGMMRRSARARARSIEPRVGPKIW